MTIIEFAYTDMNLSSVFALSTYERPTLCLHIADPDIDQSPGGCNCLTRSSGTGQDRFAQFTYPSKRCQLEHPMNVAERCNAS